MAKKPGRPLQIPAEGCGERACSGRHIQDYRENSLSICRRGKTQHSLCSHQSQTLARNRVPKLAQPEGSMRLAANRCGRRFHQSGPDSLRTRSVHRLAETASAISRRIRDRSDDDRDWCCLRFLYIARGKSRQQTRFCFRCGHKHESPGRAISTSRSEARQFVRVTQQLGRHRLG
jgi:hypothetical protein